MLYNMDGNFEKDVLLVDKLDGKELKFHEFSTDDNRTVAIVEDIDGRVNLVKADYIQFLD